MKQWSNQLKLIDLKISKFNIHWSTFLFRFTKNIRFWKSIFLAFGTCSSLYRLILKYDFFGNAICYFLKAYIILLNTKNMSLKIHLPANQQFFFFKAYIILLKYEKYNFWKCTFLAFGIFSTLYKYIKLRKIWKIIIPFPFFIVLLFRYFAVSLFHWFAISLVRYFISLYT